MNNSNPSMPVFRFDPGTVGTFRKRQIQFIRRANTGYLVNFQESPEAAKIPQVMRGSRPDLEFVGRQIIPHEELTQALIDGTLEIDEGDLVFIDHCQSFKPEFAASLDDRPAQDLILRYATVMLMREICAEKGIIKTTRAAVAGIESEIRDRLPARIDALNCKVDFRRRHPMRRQNIPKEVATAQSVLEWDERLRVNGFSSLVDRRYLSGNRRPKVHPVVAEIIEDVLRERVTREKITIKALHREIERQVLAERGARENALQLRQQDGETIPPEDKSDLERIVVPSKATVGNWKKRMAPIEQLFQINGPDWLLRNQLITGEGLNVERAGQIVMIDEYDIDLMAIVPFEFLIHWLGTEKVRTLKIVDDKPTRIVLSVTMDAFTGCILGLQMNMTATPELAKRTVMMSMMDKTKIAQACGTEGHWNQFLRPEKLMHDSGNAYVAYETDALCAQLNIDKVAAPKAKAYIRGLLERVFRTIHQTLLESIPGKTFSNTVLRGEYDSEAEAVLSLDDLIQILTIWIVDIYHESPSFGRDGQTPADLWRHEMTVGMGCRPVPGLRTLSHVFGTTLNRQAQQTGIRIAHANYFSEEFALHLLRDPTRRYRVRWWEENMSEAQVEIRQDTWLPLEVMDERARGLSVQEWLLVLERAHVKRNPEAEGTRRKGYEKIDDIVQDRIVQRRKIARKTLMTEDDVTRLEEQALRFFTTPTTRVTSDQTHGLYGAPISARSKANEKIRDHDKLDRASPNLQGDDPARRAMKSEGPSHQNAPKGRRKTKPWKPGTME